MGIGSQEPNVPAQAGAVPKEEAGEEPLRAQGREKKSGGVIGYAPALYERLFCRILHAIYFREHHFRAGG
jgi:hypothetical protein